jgi:NAD(P)H-flavin reductase
MIPPAQFTARLEDKQVHNSKFIQYQFELIEPHSLDFEAGQYVSVKVSENGTRRSYSICSSPGIKHGFETLVDIEPAGLGCKFFESLAFGSEISLLAPLGKFVIQQQAAEEAIVLVGTGSGIAPLKAMVLDLLQEKQDQRQISLFWGLRYAEQICWQDEFSLLAEHFPNFSFHPVLSRAPEEWPLCRGRVTDCLSVHNLPNIPNTGYYLCGRSQMITDVSQILAQKGISPENINYEKFD